MAFSIPLAALADKMKADLETVVRKATIDVFGNVIRKTPVDSGRAKANWSVTYGTPSTAVLEREDKTPLGTYGSTMATELLKVDNLPVGGVMFLSNSLPYIRVLESGDGSKQAPQGMVRISALEFSESIRAALAK